MDILIKWEMDIEVEDGKASKRQKRIAAALEALRILRDPHSIATVFSCGRVRVDVAALSDPEVLDSLSFNGDLWFWTLTDWETAKLMAADATRSYKQVFPTLMRKLQRIANELGGTIALQDVHGCELTTIEHTKDVK